LVYPESNDIGQFGMQTRMRRVVLMTALVVTW
jgi:hypothetical protein